MMTDDRTRQAFERLRGQVDEQADPRAALQRIIKPAPPRWIPALAVAAALAALIGVAGLLGGSGATGDVADEVTSAPSSTTEQPATTATPPTTGEPAPGGPAAPDTSTPDTSSAGTDDEAPPRPVATHRVAGVRVDDVLNVRQQPDAEATLAARLAPSYAGILWTGDEAVAADGGVWYQVQLLEPTRLFNLGEPLHGGLPTGWVNAAFLEPIGDGLAVDFDRLPCELGGGIGAVQAEPEGDGTLPVDHIYSLQHGRSGGCSRLIVTVGTNFTADRWDIIDIDIRPADSIPTAALANEEGMVVAFPSIDGARPEAMQVVTDHGPILVTRNATGTFAVEFAFDVARPNYRTFPEEGRIVLDYEPILEPTPDTTAELVVVPGVHVADGAVWIEGWARPFESNLGVELSRDGEPFEARFTGSSGPDGFGSSHFVTTPASVDAWGEFFFQIEELEPGDYEVFLFSGGADEPMGIRVPFTVP